MTTEERFTKVLREFTEVFMHRSMRDFKRFMDESGLSASQVNTLMRLYYHGACDISEIGSNMGITNAGSSQLVDRMVNLGYLERSEGRHDRRVKLIALTPKGRGLIEEGIQVRMRWMEELTTALTAEEQAAITRALILITRAARKLDPQASSSEQVEEAAQIPPTPVH